MKVRRDEHYSDTRREWFVNDGSRNYRAENVWSIGSQRMEWAVYVEVSPPQVQTHWRKINGRRIIDAVNEYEHDRSEHLAVAVSD